MPPYFVHYIKPKEGRGRIFEYAISLDYTPPQKVLYVYGTAKVQVHSYKSTNDRQYCSWSSYVVSLHWREELPLQLEGHNIHDAFGFAVAILKNRNISWYFLRKSGSEVTCTVCDNGDYSICMRDDLRSCASEV